MGLQALYWGGSQASCMKFRVVYNVSSGYNVTYIGFLSGNLYRAFASWFAPKKEASAWGHIRIPCSNASKMQK